MVWSAVQWKFGILVGLGGKYLERLWGPQFSTRTESLMYRQWGGDLINMSVLPEAKLAKEALRYFLSPPPQSISY